MRTPPRRVVITGFGVTAATGVGKQAFWKAVRDGDSQVRTVSRFDAADYRTRIAATIEQESLPELELKTSPKLFDLTAAASMHAALEALEESGLNDVSSTAVLWGCAGGGFLSLDEQYENLYSRGPRAVMPYTVPRIMSSSPAALLAIELGAQGANLTFASACAASSQALGSAYRMIQAGESDACLAGGVECPVSRGHLLAWDRLRVLSPDNDRPSEACRPFSVDRNGMVLGEGAAAFVLEERGRALARGVRAWAELIGYASNCDAGNMIRPCGDRQAECLLGAIAESGIEGPPSYISAHATGTLDGDSEEARAIRRAFGDEADRIPVSTIKPVTGHTLGASGALSLAATLLAMRHSTLPPTANLTHPDPECDLRHVAVRPMAASVDNALVSTFAFGGANAVLAVARSD